MLTTYVHVLLLIQRRGSKKHLTTFWRDNSALKLEWCTNANHQFQRALFWAGTRPISQGSMGKEKNPCFQTNESFAPRARTSVHTQHANSCQNILTVTELYKIRDLVQLKPRDFSDAIKRNSDIEKVPTTRPRKQRRAQPLFKEKQKYMFGTFWPNQSASLL